MVCVTRHAVAGNFGIYLSTAFFSMLKLFQDEGRAEANAAQFRAANAHGWPVPAEYYRGTAAPYSDQPALVMEFLSGGTLRTRIKRQFERGGAPDTGAIAAAYAAVGAELGRLHKAHVRARNERDRSGVVGLQEVTKRCQAEGWCGKGAQERLAYLAQSMDAGSVTFVHGDLYEQQVIIGPDGGVAGFIDLDQAGFADPAADVGQLLAHVLLLNPRTREAAWQVPNPTPAETRATAEAFLGAYRDAAGLTGTDWANFLRRARGHMWKRFGDVLQDLRGNPHGAPLVQIIDADKEVIAGSDPLADFQISL